MLIAEHQRRERHSFPEGLQGMLGWKPHVCAAGQDGEPDEASAALALVKARCWAAKPESGDRREQAERKKSEDRKRDGGGWVAVSRISGCFYPSVNREPLGSFNQEHSETESAC